MRRFGLVLLVAIVGAVLVPRTGGAAPRDGDVIPGAWIVAVADGASPEDVARGHAARHGASIDHVYGHALRGYAGRFSAATAARIAADPQVRSMVADRRVIVAKPAGKPGGGGGGSQPAQVVPTGVARIGGAGKTIGAAPVAVAIIDTGIANHGDLQIAGGVNCSTGKSYGDGNGHGTHVAGTVGARDNGFGVVGVAPGVPLYAVRVLNNAGSGSWSSVICGVDWVTANSASRGIKVANMSLGGSGSEGSCADGGLREAVCDAVAAGVTVVVAAGNESTDAATKVPATYDEAITVSALADFDGLAGGHASATCRSDVDDTFADFSNFGADVDLIAPGVCILSTWNDGGYNTISGTSMASPHVAGAAALWLSKQPTTKSPAEVKAALLGAGTNDWDSTDGRDGIKEPLLNVTATGF